MKAFATLLIPFAVATSAFAGVNGEATPDYPMSVASSVQRADVAAQATSARAMGVIADGEVGSRFAADTGMSLTRAQVQAELDVARSLGLVAIGERSVEPTVAQLQAIGQAGKRVASSQMASR